MDTALIIQTPITFCLVCAPLSITFEIMNLIDSWHDSMDGGSVCDKAATYTGEHKHRTEADIHTSSGIQTNNLSILTQDIRKPFLTNKER
jgi:hypothetical protein